MHLLPTVKESDLSGLAAVYMGDAFRDRGLLVVKLQYRGPVICLKIAGAAQRLIFPPAHFYK